MTGRFERMLQPGERLVFRTTWGWKIYGKMALLSLKIAAAFGVILTIVFPPDDLAFGVGAIFSILYRFAQFTSLGTLFYLTVFPMFVLCTVFGPAAAVTDRRVLYRSRYLRPRVVEVPLGHIERLERMKGWVRIRDRSSEAVELLGLADSNGLGTAILDETGAPGPVEPEGRIKAWSNHGANLAYLCGIVVTILVFWFVVRPSVMFPQIAEMVPDDKSTKLLLQLSILLVVPILVCLASVTGGALLMTLMMKQSLSAAEARQVFDAILQHVLEVPLQRKSARKWFLKWRDWPFTVARRFAGRLYGTPI